jgi:ketosteroid isomerase-like protein
MGTDQAPILPAADAAVAAASETTRRFREAAQAGDVEALLATLAEDVVLRSPITDRVTFHGRQEIRELMRSVFATVENIRYFADVGDARTRALFDRATVGGQALEQAIRVELDERHQIAQITIFFRPLPGLAGLTAALGPRVARKHGPARALIARVLLAPLALATRAGDRLARWLA